MTPAAALNLLERAKSSHRRQDWRFAARALGEVVAELEAARKLQEPRQTESAPTYQPTPIRPPAITREPARPSLCDFLAERGLRDDGGELRARDLDRRHRSKPFRRRLIRDGGMGLEAAAELAWDHGYLPDVRSADEATAEILLAAMERELAADFPALHRPAPCDDDYYQALEPEEVEGWERVA